MKPGQRVLCIKIGLWHGTSTHEIVPGPRQGQYLTIKSIRYADGLILLMFNEWPEEVVGFDSKKFVLAEEKKEQLEVLNMEFCKN